MNETSDKQTSEMVDGTIPAQHAEPISNRKNLANQTRRIWKIISLAVNKFLQIDGAQWSGTFAFNAFFSLFPLIVIFVTSASIFIDHDKAGKEVIAYIERFVPISGEMQYYIIDTISGVIKARKQAGLFAFLILGWTAIQFFTVLILATNRAWGANAHNWWRQPLKSLFFLTIMGSLFLLGVVVPVLAKMAKDWLFPSNDFSSWVYTLGSILIPLLVVFLSLSLFYKLAPRRPTRFAEVWIAALVTTALLLIAQNLFVIYLKSFATLNAVYGAFGGIMALLLWIYLSGCIFIFGACLCAAQSESNKSTSTFIS